jgi:hypothetical protein
MGVNTMKQINNKLDYPINVIYSIFKDQTKMFDKELSDFESNPHLFTAFEYVLSFIKPKHIEVIRKYFKEKKTLEEIGIERGVTRSMIQVDISDAIREISTCENFEIMTVDFIKFIKGQRIFEKNTAYENGYEDGYAVGYDDGHKNACMDSEKQNCDPLDTPIEMLDLSVRAFNCLKRNGINTLRQLSLTEPEKLSSIRNLGKRTYAELVTLLEKHCVDVSGY